jgi:alpha-tubulin suppressor-like RCC1 family protein
MSATLLCINRFVAGYESIVAAAKDTVRVVVYDPYEDTYNALLQRIKALNTKFSLAGFVFHSSGTEDRFSLLKGKSAIVQAVNRLDPRLESWSDVNAFLKALRMSCGVTTVDLITCNIGSNPYWKYILQNIRRSAGIQIRTSTNPTGNPSQGGDWFQETSNTNIKNVYFTDKISEFKGTLYFAYYRASGFDATEKSKTSHVMMSVEIPVSPYSYKIFSPNTSLITLGEGSYGGLMQSGPNTVSSQLTSDVVGVCANNHAYAAVKRNGAVVAWGFGPWGGELPSAAAAQMTSGVVAIASSSKAFAALKANGTVVGWGELIVGLYTAIPATAPSGLTNVVALVGGYEAFTALKSNGSVVTWGGYGQYGPTPIAAPTDTGFVKIIASQSAFVAIKSDGTIKAWGRPDYGGSIPESVSSVLSTKAVSEVIGNAGGFTALTSDGTVVSWGEGMTTPTINTGYTAICANESAFAGMRTDGTVIAWGYPNPVANIGQDASSVAAYISDPSSNTFSPAKAITPSKEAFAVRRANGTVVCWGNFNNWVNVPDLSSNPVFQPVIQATSEIVSVASGNQTFVAIDASNNAISWGMPEFGGGMRETNVNEIIYGDRAAIVRKKDGTVVYWGYSTFTTLVGGTLSGAIIGANYNEQSFVVGQYNYNTDQINVLTALNTQTREQLKQTIANTSESQEVKLYAADLLRALTARSSIIDAAALLSATIMFLKIVNGVAAPINTSQLSKNAILYFPLTSASPTMSITIDGKVYNITEFPDSQSITIEDLSVPRTDEIAMGSTWTLGDTEFVFLGFGSLVTTQKGNTSLGTTTNLTTLAASSLAKGVSQGSITINPQTFNAYEVYNAALSTTPSGGGGGGGGGGGSIPCFLGSAPVLTPTGYTKISKLKEGDMVLSNGEAVPITRTSVTRVAAGPSVNPYRIPKNLYAATKNLSISPDHKVAVVGGGLVEAKHLGLEQIAMEGEIEYYNIEIEGNGNMTVAGVEVESLAPLHRIEITSDQLTALLMVQYGVEALTNPAIIQHIKRTCRMGSNGLISCPVMRK